MKVIDLSLFNKQPEFGFKAISGNEYQVTFINGTNELTLMQEQEDIAASMGKWKNVSTEQLEKWTQILKKLLRECKAGYDVTQIDKDIDELKPLHIMTILYNACKYLNDRGKIIYEVFPDDIKKKVKSLEKEVKKKATSALSE